MFDGKKYADVCIDAVNRIYQRELKNRGNAKEAEKATKAKLHQMTGAFMTVEEMKRARECLARYLEGDVSALTDALKTHASTRERLRDMDALYDRVFSATGAPKAIKDLACGINPLYLGAKGFRVRGYDVGGGQVRIVNEWARALSWDVQADVCDLAAGMPEGDADLVLMMKLLPVLEAQEKGAGARLLAQTQGFALVTFPTRTLGGRSVGMERQYSHWMENNLPNGMEILDRYAVTGELCYVVKGGKEGAHDGGTLGGRDADRQSERPDAKDAGGA
ncbi:MAG: Rmt family 16S rRNA (guanine(1405)-N(7))-methyltransferase [Christensenellales bacterium]